jgi:hypothetical protein
VNILDILKIGSTILDRVIPDPQARAAAQLEMFKAQQAGEFKELDNDLQLALAQNETNKIEASSDMFFKSGWRPFVGWVCGTGLAYQFLIRPLLVGITGHEYPELDMGTLITLLGGLLGLGSLRTFEKAKGVA